MRQAPFSAVIAACALALAAPVAAQEPGSGWTPERTAWGHPDLQGIWDQTTGTPLERAADAGDREFLSHEEAAERERRRFAAFDAPPPGRQPRQLRIAVALGRAAPPSTYVSRRVRSTPSNARGSRYTNMV